VERGQVWAREAGSMETRPQRPRWFVVVVWALAALIIGLDVAIAVGTFVPAVSSGIVLGPDFETVVGVATDSPAYRAGIRLNDVLADTPGRAALIEELRRVRAAPNEPYQLTVRRGTRTFTASIVPQCCMSAAQIDYASGLYAITELFVAIVAILIAAWLATVRPGLMTFAFFLAMPNFGLDGTIPGLPREVNLWVYSLSVALTYNALWFALPIFGLRFPDDRVAGWRVIAQRICIAVLIAAQAAVVLSCFSDALQGSVNDLGLFGNVPAGLTLVYASALAVMVTVVFMVARYAESDAAMRAQVRWGLIGSVIALIQLTVQIVVFALPTTRSTEIFLAINGLFVIVLPICVAYALLRTRFVDPAFVLNRATVFFLTGAILATIIGFVHWLTVRYISERGLALALDALVTIILGFLLTAVHRRAEAAVERVLFRRRHDAFAYLAKLGIALSAAPRAQAVEEALAVDVPRELSLASGAAFRREPKADAYVRVAATGWDGAGCLAISMQDPLIRFLRVEGTPLRAAEYRWSRSDGPQGAAAPVLAVPVMLRGEVAAFALYGAHLDHSEIDSGEVQEIATLAERSSAALDHVEATNLRAELSDLERRYITLLERVAGSASQP
jgi:hypothetical protein